MILLSSIDQKWDFYTITHESPLILLLPPRATMGFTIGANCTVHWEYWFYTYNTIAMLLLMGVPLLPMGVLLPIAADVTPTGGGTELKTCILMLSMHAHLRMILIGSNSRK